MASKPSIDIDLSGIEEKFSPEELKKKQAAFAHRVGFDMNKHCPYDEGTLHDSMPKSSDFENGQVVWDTPYAKRVMNADTVMTVKNSEARPQWPEYTKSERLGEWRKFAANLLGDGAAVRVGALDD